MQTFRIFNLVPGPIVAQIGRICVHWSIMELTMERVIWHLSGISPKAGRLVTARQNIDPRIKRLKKLARQYLTNEAQEEIYAICRDIKDVQEQRNWAVHGLYGINKHGERFQISYRKDPNGVAKPVNDNSLREVRRAIYRLQIKLEQFLPLPKPAEPA